MNGMGVERPRPINRDPILSPASLFESTRQLSQILEAQAIQLTPIVEGIQQCGVNAASTRSEHVGVVEVAHMQRGVGPSARAFEGCLEDPPIRLLETDLVRVDDFVEERQQSDDPEATRGRSG